MLLKYNGIVDIDTWFAMAPPKGKERHWKDKRSAKELARYMMSDYPHIPKEIENALLHFTDENIAFNWAAEYVTELFGKGEGRNHDAFLSNRDIVVGIEGKADEPLGSQLIEDAFCTASENKKQRIEKMIQMIFGDSPKNHKNIRYQLVTAISAILLEAKKRQTKKAMLMVIVFKSEECSEKKLQANEDDIRRFLEEIAAKSIDDCYLVPTVYGQENNIELYFKYIEINL